MAFKASNDAARLQASVQRRQISEIYHYTAISNLPSVFRHGALLTRAQMDARGIGYVGHGWGRPGKDKELEEFFCCGLKPHWGMLRKETEPQAVVSLKPELIWRDGTLFCPGNSASNEYDRETLKGKTTVEAFDAMFDNPISSFPSPYQCEVLVYNEVSLEYFRAVNFQTDDHLQSAFEMLKNVQVPKEHHGVLPIGLAVNSHLYPPQRFGAL